jgi:hypothetical protein
MLHIAPALRERENAAQNAGLQVVLDSQGYTVQKNQEAAALQTHTAFSAGETFIFVNTVYNAT